MAKSLAPPPKFTVYYQGAPASGAKVNVYLTGTTTPTTTYSTRGGTVNANPVICDSRGECSIFLTAGEVVDFVVTTSSDVAIYTQVGVTSANAEDISFIQSGTGAVATTVTANMRNAYAVPQFGSVGTADDTTVVQTAINAAKTAGAILLFTGVTHTLSAAIYNRTTATLASNPVNGIHWVGAPGAKLKAHVSFPANTPLIDLDGNTGNQTAAANAVAQQFNHVHNFEIDGSSVADRGLRLKAVRFSSFKNLYLHDFAGTNTDAAIYIASSAAAGEDDVDTTDSSSFENIRINTSTGYGVWGATSRNGSLKWDTCYIGNCSYDGMRMSFASLHLTNCVFVSNGSNSSSTVGGFTAATSATFALNRGLVITDCLFEANYNHEVNIDQCDGFLIQGGSVSPYVSAASTQDIMRFGVETTSGLVNAGIVEGVRIQNYAAGAHTITGMQVGSCATNIAFNNVSFYTGTSDSWNTQALQYNVNAHCAGITRDGVAISARHNIPMFYSTATTSGTAITDVTGDGTEYPSSTFIAAGGTQDTYNTGPITTSFAITASISGTSLTVTAVTGTPIWVGQSLVDLGLGVGASSPPDVLPNTYITAFIGGTGGTGTYEINKSQTVSSRGMRLINTQPYKQGVFTAPKSGFYQFHTQWPCTGFGGAETDIEVAFIKNIGGSQTRYVVYKARPDAALNAAAINTYNGSAQIQMSAGDTMVSTIKISGGTKIVDIYRNITAPGGWVFSGRAL